MEKVKISNKPIKEMLNFELNGEFIKTDYDSEEAIESQVEIYDYSTNIDNFRGLADNHLMSDEVFETCITLIRSVREEYKKRTKL